LISGSLRQKSVRDLESNRQVFRNLREVVVLDAGTAVIDVMDSRETADHPDSVTSRATLAPRKLRP
jgi:hypothetical protein